MRADDNRAKHQAHILKDAAKEADSMILPEEHIYRFDSFRGKIRFLSHVRTGN